MSCFFFFFNDTATTEIYTLSLHDALPIFNSAPPDTNGDVGPNHYVQTVNTDFAIFNKSGTAIYGPVAINTLWSGFGGGCQSNNDGDPTVIYDPISDRWVISQFSARTTPFLHCVAGST